MAYEWYGHFSNEGKNYVITQPNTPRHWYNYMYNDEYITFSSQVGFGEGFAQDNMGRRIPLVMNRNFFLCEDEYWSLAGLPINYGYTDYSCTHTAGSTTINLRYNDISSSVRIFVPNNKMQEIWTISLKNHSNRRREVSLIPYAKTDVDSPYKPQGYNIATGDVYKEKNCVYGFFYQAFNSQRNLPMYGYMSSSQKISGFDTRKTAFVGAYSDEQRPEALNKNLKCTNSSCFAEKLCFALQNDIVLEANEQKTLHFVLGVSFSKEEIVTPEDKWVQQQFQAMEDKYEQRIRQVQIKTPWENFDNLVNGWLPYATDMGSRWARVRHNGYRDMSQDTDCFSVINPSLAWERIKRVLTYQYDNGYAPRTIIDGVLKDRNFSDNTVWLTFAVYDIVKELGDITILNEQVKFNNSKQASVYEHIRRSVDFLWNFTGLYGLIRIWGGDWNDCINYAGLEGKGVSVWLSIAWCLAAKQIAELSGMLGFDDYEKLYQERYQIMKDRIDQHGWDGQYYIYARTDEDIVLGSHTQEEGKIFLNPQIWAVFANLNKDNRHIKSMDKAEELLQSDEGILLSKPPYTKQYDYIGSMAEKPGGIQDNGGVYLHPAAWKLAADSILKNNGRVEENLKKMLPFDNDYYETKGEPYCMFNCYYLDYHGYRRGTPGQSWRTGTNAWLLKSTVMYIFGLHPEMEGLRLEPCLPESWRECSITKKFRNCKYIVKYIQTEDGACNNISKILVDEEEKDFDNFIIPPVEGKQLNITVWLTK